MNTDVYAFRLGPWTIGLLVAVAACGRIGYEGSVKLVEADGPIPAVDAADVRLVDAGVDQQPPRADLAPDLAPDLTPDLARDVAADLTPDVMTVDATPTGRTVVATGQTATARRGASGGEVMVDLCPDGGLLVGFEGTHSTNPNTPWIQSLNGVCARVTLSAPGTATPTWGLTRLPTHGDPDGASWTRLCPAGQVLVGFDGNAGQWWIGQLVFRCAPIALAASGGAVVLGSESELDDVGASGNNDFPQTDCPPGQAARGAEIRIGMLLEAFALTCGTLAVR